MERTRSKVRHDARGMLNALKLCVSALAMPLATSDKLQFLSDVEFAAGRLAELVCELETYSEEPGALPDEGDVVRPVRSSSDVRSRSV